MEWSEGWVEERHREGWKEKLLIKKRSKQSH